MKTHVFHDFDAFIASVRGVEAVMMLQNPARRSWAVDEVVLPQISVQYGRLGSGNIIEGQGVSDAYLIYLPLTDACEYSANGVVMDKGSFTIFEPECDFSFSTKFEHDWCTILVPSDKFSRDLDLEALSSGSPKSVCRVTRKDRRVANQFRTLVSQTMAAAANGAQFERSLAARMVEAELLKVASKVVGQRLEVQRNHGGRPPCSREEIIHCCKKLLDQHHDKPIHLGEMAAAAGVSERTLRRAFTEHYGVGPVRYLQLRQLHQVHRALRAAHPEEQLVSEILMAYGEWAFSRSAFRYRQLFGELPSETLRSKSKS
jgi:AraC family ethanolamine operon transcriptional activator